MSEDVFGIVYKGTLYSNGTLAWPDGPDQSCFLFRSDPEGDWTYTSEVHGHNKILLTTEQAQALVRRIEFSDTKVIHVPFAYAAEPEPNVADMAKAAVLGPRMKDYGPPEENFERWSAMCKAMGYDLNIHDLCKIMIALKLARFAHNYKLDSLVDIVGYSLLAERFHDLP